MVLLGPQAEGASFGMPRGLQSHLGHQAIKVRDLSLLDMTPYLKVSPSAAGRRVHAVCMEQGCTHGSR